MRFHPNWPISYRGEYVGGRRTTDTGKKKITLALKEFACIPPVNDNAEPFAFSMLPVLLIEEIWPIRSPRATSISVEDLL